MEFMQINGVKPYFYTSVQCCKSDKIWGVSLCWELLYNIVSNLCL